MQPKAKGTGVHHSNWKGRLGVLFKALGQQGQGKVRHHLIQEVVQAGAEEVLMNREVDFALEEALEHLLSNYSKAPGNGDYLWQKTTRTLYTTCDWQLQVNLREKLRFLQHIKATCLWPDIMMTSEVTKTTDYVGTHSGLAKVY